MFLQQTPEPVSILNYLPLVFILAIFYLIVFLPARRRQKKLDDMIANLKTGDKVITNGGIYGTIVGFKADRIQLRSRIPGASDSPLWLLGDLAVRGALKRYLAFFSADERNRGLCREALVHRKIPA